MLQALLFCAAIPAAFLLEVVSEYAIFPLWYLWNPGRSVGYWLLKTPLASTAAHVRFFFLFLPDLLTILLAGAVIARLLPSLRRRLCVAFALAFLVLNGRVAIYWLDSVHSGWGNISFFSLVILCYLGFPFLGGALYVRLFTRPKPLPGRCEKCGYILKGLPTNRCPECGTLFNPEPSSPDLLTRS